MTHVKEIRQKARSRLAFIYKRTKSTLTPLRRRKDDPTKFTQKTHFITTSSSSSSSRNYIRAKSSPALIQKQQEIHEGSIKLEDHVFHPNLSLVLENDQEDHASNISSSISLPPWPSMINANNYNDDGTVVTKETDEDDTSTQEGGGEEDIDKKLLKENENLDEEELRNNNNNNENNNEDYSSTKINSALVESKSPGKVSDLKKRLEEIKFATAHPKNSSSSSSSSSSPVAEECRSPNGNNRVFDLRKKLESIHLQNQEQNKIISIKHSTAHNSPKNTPVAAAAAEVVVEASSSSSSSPPPPPEASSHSI